MSGVFISSLVIIVLIIAATIVVTIKAYSVTHKESVDPLPPNNETNGIGPR